MFKKELLELLEYDYIDEAIELLKREIEKEEDSALYDLACEICGEKGILSGKIETDYLDYYVNSEMLMATQVSLSIKPNGVGLSEEMKNMAIDRCNEVFINVTDKDVVETNGYKKIKIDLNEILKKFEEHKTDLKENPHSHFFFRVENIFIDCTELLKIISATKSSVLFYKDFDNPLIIAGKDTIVGFSPYFVENYETGYKTKTELIFVN